MRCRESRLGVSNDAMECARSLEGSLVSPTVPTTPVAWGPKSLAVPKMSEISTRCLPQSQRRDAKEEGSHDRRIEEKEENPRREIMVRT